MRSVLRTQDGDWDHMTFRRRLETFNKDDGAILASNSGETDGIW